LKKIIKRVLLVLGAIFIFLVSTGLSYYYPMLVMPPVKTGKVPDTNVYTANAMSAVYFIETNSGYIMIDAGLTIKKLQASLKEVMIDPNDVKWILLTHSDGDHVNGLTLFPNAEIYMSEDELQLLNGTTKRNVFGGTVMPSGIDVDKINLLTEGQELLLNGVAVQCIKAPGHTTGSMAYRVDGKYLFTGDVLKIKNGKMSVHPYSMDKEQSKKTIEQLMGIIENSSIVITSHYGLYQ